MKSLQQWEHTGTHVLMGRTSTVLVLQKVLMVLFRTKILTLKIIVVLDNEVNLY